MQPRSYYRVITDPQNDVASHAPGLQVNCTGYSVYGPKDPVVADSVRQDYYLIFLVEGTISVTRPALPRALRTGDWIIFTPGQHFSYEKKSGEPLVYYWVHFTGGDAATLLERCGLCTDTIYIPQGLEAFHASFLRLFEAFSQRDSLFDLYASQIFNLLLMDLSRALSQDFDPGKNRVHHDFSRSVSYIHDHLSQPISVKELSEMEFLSVSRYRTLFRERLGVSPQEYVIFAKLNYACQLLKNTRIPISEVSLAVGYSDPQYFSRLFSKHMGASPAHYRK